MRPELVVTGARGTHDRSDFLLVQVVTSGGFRGLGEVSATLLWSGEDATTADHVIRTAIAPALLGLPLVPVSRLELEMDRVAAGNPFTKAGVATALWDAYARALDVPLAVALGGPLRSEVPVKCSLSGSGERLRGVYRAASDAGFGSFKLKVGLHVEEDAERLAFARDLVGGQFFLGADANGGYSRQDAARALDAFRPYSPAFLEQPVEPEDLDGMAALRGRGIPIVADESVFGMTSLRNVLRAEAADVVSLYIGKSGGPGRAVAMATAASAVGVGVILGSNGELGVGAAAQIHVACAAPGLVTDIPSDIIGAHYYTDDVLSRSPEITGRVARLTDQPGLGIDDDDAVWGLFTQTE